MYVRSLVLTVTLLASTAAASPAPEVVVVASSDDGFRTALNDALTPTGMQVKPTADEAPSVAELSATARQIAEREGATSTVWLIFAADKTTLVTYDLDVDRVLVREVPYSSPLNATQAAEVARMARTMLRTLRVSPEIDRPLPRVAEARVERMRVASVVRTNEIPRQSHVAIGIAATVRVGAAASDAGLDGRISAMWRPDGIGAALQLSIATRGDLATSSLMASVADDSLALTAHAPLLRGPNVHVLGIAGPALHAISVTGSTGNTDVSTVRIDPAMRVGLVASYELGRFDIGLVMSVDALLRRQRYASGSDELLLVPRVQMSTGISVAVRFL